VREADHVPLLLSRAFFRAQMGRRAGRLSGVAPMVRPVESDLRRPAPPGLAASCRGLETLFGATIVNADGKHVPVRLIGEQHVIEDLGFIPSFADWGRLIAPQAWMLKGRRLDQPLDDTPPVEVPSAPFPIAA
jgi:hypothetical protein